MSTIIISDKTHYLVRDPNCIGRPCLNIHRISIRGATGASGSRFVGYRDCCARRDYYGCPSPIPEFDKKLAAERKKNGMKNHGGLQ